MTVALIYDPKSEWPALTSDMEGANPITMTEWQQPLYLIKWEHIPQSHQNGPALISYRVRLHPIVISEWPLVPN